MRKTTTAIAIATLLISNLSFAQCPLEIHAKVPVITNKTYHEARQLLLDAGWQPMQTIHYNDIDNPVIRYGNGQTFWAKGYVEIDDCAGTGFAPCLFNFTDVYSNRLQVMTQGEEYPEYDAYALVNGYRFQCE